MSRTNFYFKVELEHEPEDPPERLANEILRQVTKIYGVREAELASFTTVDE